MEPDECDSCLSLGQTKSTKSQDQPVGRNGSCIMQNSYSNFCSEILYELRSLQVYFFVDIFELDQNQSNNRPHIVDYEASHSIYVEFQLKVDRMTEANRFVVLCIVVG